MAQRVEVGEERSAENEIDPRGSEPIPAGDDEISAPQEFDTGSPDKQDRTEGADDLDDGPIAVSEIKRNTC